jgi:hypothetical protein
MYLCYIDESGDTGQLKSATDSTQPLIAIGGIIVNYTRLHGLTHDLIDLNQRMFPGAAPPGCTRLGRILYEIKGAELRKNIGRGTDNQRRHSIHYVDEVISLMNKHDIRVIARIWIKGIAKPFDGVPVYTSSIQALYEYFQRFLTANDDYGFVIADSRSKTLNVNVSHSVFTQKYRFLGDRYDRIFELPTFVHSDNHAGLQIADTFCSAMLFPIASHVYCAGHVSSVHVQPKFALVKSRCVPHLRTLQYRYQDAAGAWRGGIVVSDAIGQRSGSLIFK